MDRIGKLTALLDAHPGDNFISHALALELVKEGRDDEARKWFESILSRDPDYVGSYYHYAKLLERINEPALAAEWYRKGMEAAKRNNDGHAYNELQAAFGQIQD